MSNENKRSDNLSDQDQTTMSRVEQRQPKKRSKKRIILMILGFLILLGAGFGTYYASSVKSSLDKAYFATGLGLEKEASTLIKEKKADFISSARDRHWNGWWIWLWKRQSWAN
ncbi:hypothetical protein LNP18_02635 [Leuconostoc citreum]|uniref:hypothetical protein n=1 Tax=Leuconostoc citreum TaxID=33964 RepID=UPI00200A73AC|nr:hypothetical protein [Leuconostoc citreum]MCK8604994.1 hypothetical protein [Leuconostoc citreum]